MVPFSDNSGNINAVGAGFVVVAPGESERVILPPEEELDPPGEAAEREPAEDEVDPLEGKDRELPAAGEEPDP